MRSLAERRWRDLTSALTTMPDARAWVRCACVYAVFLGLAMPIGLMSGLVRPGWPHAGTAELATGVALVFIHPALVEELVFRGLLLPRDPRSMRRGPLAALTLVALAVYVASHPLNALLVRPSAAHVFGSPAYLTMAALLGAACTASYWFSRSLWPSILIHWLTVAAWLWLLGGSAVLC